MLISALLRTLSATVSGCFFHGDDIVDIVRRFGMDSGVEGVKITLVLVSARRLEVRDVGAG